MSAIVKDRLLGIANFALGTNNVNWSTSGTPNAVIGGRVLATTARASAAASKTDSVTEKAAPEVDTGETFAVVVTVGFTGTNRAQEYHELFSQVGGVGRAPAALPTHVADGHVPVGFVLFRNNHATTKFQWGTSNMNVVDNEHQKVYQCVELPNRAPWEDVEAV